MEFSGELINVNQDWKTGKFNITFSVNERCVLEEVNELQDCKLSIKAVKHRKKRSLDANALLWHCLGQIAGELRADKWDIYLNMLRRYGQFTYICVKPNMVDAVKQQWRECEVIGDIDINGKPAVQMLCYFGSSCYDTKQFTILLDGVIDEMKGMGLETPLPEDLRRALEKWEEQHPS